MGEAPKNYVVYGLHAGDGVIRYVGKTSRDPQTRLKEHLKAARYSKGRHVLHWIRENFDSIVMEILERPDDADSANLLEIAWIAKLREQGNNLTNATDGGDGRRGLVLTAEHRAAVIAAHRGKVVPREVIERQIASRAAGAGWKVSDDQRAKMRAAMFARIARGDIPNKGKSRTDEMNQANRERQFAKVISGDAHQAKLNPGAVREIRHAHEEGETIRSIAARYGVHYATIADVVKRKSWAFVEDVAA